MTDASSNRVECDLPAFQGTYACDPCQRAGRCLGTRKADATRNRVQPYKRASLEDMVKRPQCWVTEGTVRRLAKLLLERAT